jgi:hypothetical protein
MGGVTTLPHDGRLLAPSFSCQRQGLNDWLSRLVTIESPTVTVTK